MASQNQLYEQEMEELDWARLMAGARAARGADWWEASELLVLPHANKVVPPRVRSKPRPGLSLSSYLDHRKGRWSGELLLEATGGNPRQWRIRTLDEVLDQVGYPHAP